MSLIAEQLRIGYLAYMFKTQLGNDEIVQRSKTATQWYKIILG